MGKNCVICGKPTGTYVFCKEHQKEKEEGKIIKCEKCGTWHYINTPCSNCEENSIEDKYIPQTDIISKSKCIVCGDNAPYGQQCKNCYYETKEYIDGLNKNSKNTEFRDYYFNLKDVIFRMKDINIIQTNCNKLIAIALLNEKVNDDTALTSRVYNDVKKLIEEKTKKHEFNITVTEKDIENDEKKSQLKHAQDGHVLDSDMEVIIDDILYNACILHCCHQPIVEFVEMRKKSDWFIPINGTSQGIYIEYWGMNKAKYLQDKQEKKNLYEKYKNTVALVEIEKDDPKHNTQEFKARLLRDIQEKAITYFGHMPKWC